VGGAGAHLSLGYTYDGLLIFNPRFEFLNSHLDGSHELKNLNLGRNPIGCGSSEGLGFHDINIVHECVLWKMKKSVQLKPEARIKARCIL
jgi:hypothetical protein